MIWIVFFFSSRRRHTRCGRDWSSDVCSSDLPRRGRRSSGTYGDRWPVTRALLEDRTHRWLSCPGLITEQGTADMSCSGHPVNYGAYAGEPLICALGGQAQLLFQRCHSWAISFLEQGPDHSGCLVSAAAREVWRIYPGGERDLQAPPYVGGVGRLFPDASREGLE